MGQSIQLNTSRMQCIGAYLARPEGTPKGGLVVAQEIFGVNAHMRAVVDRFAAHGWVAIAPAFFDHVETGVELGYDEEGFRRGCHGQTRRRWVVSARRHDRRGWPCASVPR